DVLSGFFAQFVQTDQVAGLLQAFRPVVVFLNDALNDFGCDLKAFGNLHRVLRNEHELRHRYYLLTRDWMRLVWLTAIGHQSKRRTWGRYCTPPSAFDL